jgi:hypothetical protein
MAISCLITWRGGCGVGPLHPLCCRKLLGPSGSFELFEMSWRCWVVLSDAEFMLDLVDVPFQGWIACSVVRPGTWGGILAWLVISAGVFELTSCTSLFYWCLWAISLSTKYSILWTQLVCRDLVCWSLWDERVLVVPSPENQARTRRLHFWCKLFILSF